MAGRLPAPRPFWALLFWLSILPLVLSSPLQAWGGNPLAAAAGKTDTDKTPPVQEAPKAPPEPLLVIVNRHMNDLPRQLLKLEEILEDSSRQEEIEKKLDELDKRFDELAWKVTLEKSNPSPSYSRLSELVKEKEQVNSGLDKLQKQVTGNLTRLARQKEVWQEERTRLMDWRKQAKKDKDLQLVFSGRTHLLKEMDGAFARVTERIAEMITLSGSINSRQMKLDTLNGELQELVREAQGIQIQQTAPSILSGRFYQLLSLELQQVALKKVFSGLIGQFRLLAAHGWIVPVALALILFLAAAIRMSSPREQGQGPWQLFGRRPLATSFFLAMSLPLLGGWLTSSLVLSVESSGLILICTLLAMVRLAGLLTDRWLYRHVLLPMIFVLILSLGMQISRLPLLLTHLTISLVSLFGLLLFAKNILLDRRRLSSINRWILQIIAVFFLVILGAEIAGYSRVALYLFRSTLYSILLGLVFWLLYFISKGLLELFLTRVPVRILRGNCELLVREATPVLAVLYGLFYLLISFVIWQVFPTVTDAAGYFATLGLDIGSFRVTPGHLLLIFLVLYLTLSFSRAMQAVLLQELLPRYGVDIGVQFSITRLVHYGILVIGFLLLLQVLGVEMNKLAILGGALGVGIGFGLQAIVNNFASGLILLFERPLKVGDMIQVGTEMGEVRKLGLRATVVRTFDAADIVIPNSDLITGQVTNWTLGDRQVRVKIPVGVAYGTDIAQVQEILLSCAENNPMVLSQPRPRALFLAFGASSLDFELRVWVTDFTDRRQVLSELNQDIESEFSAAGIEIPFPQTDLHLRSVDPEVIRATS